jgi:hypothetical protein
MKRREFLIEGSAVLTMLGGKSWAQLNPPPQASPTVVNPVFRSANRSWDPLSGKWHLVLDPERRGIQERWFAPDFSPSSAASAYDVNVPGTWEANGVGKPGLSNPTARELSRIFLKNKYVGVGWYQKTFTVPSEFTGKRVWLKIGGVNSLGMFWVNGKYLGTLHKYTSGAYKYEITSHLQPGLNVVTVLVSNKENSRKGGEDWLDQFGGLYRDVELEASSSTYIDDAWVRPDFDNQRVFVCATLASPWTTASTGHFSVTADVTSIEDGRSAGSGRASVSQVVYTGTAVEIPVSLVPFRPWSPEHPSLYKVEVTLLEDGRPIDGWTERSGVRKLEGSGHDILLNGKKHFLRGFGDDYIYPLTISSPASKEYHRKHLELARSYGFTFVRHHTHAENPEYYEAADEAGIMIQASLPYEGILPSPPGPYQPMDDLTELCRQYRRYVSLSVYSMGNEGLHAKQYRRTLYRTAKMMDPTRLVMHQDGGVNYEGISDLRGGPIKPPVAEAEVTGGLPVILHEYLNLCGPQDPRLEPKYTGAEAPSLSLQKEEQRAAALGLDWELVERAIDGGHELQSIFQKFGLENARSVAGVNGYDYWTIADVLQLMPQGLLDPFWAQKRSTPAYFRRFNSDVVLLLPELSVKGFDRVFSSGDSWSQPLRCSNFSDRALEMAVAWCLSDGTKTYAQGQMRSRQVAQGALADLGLIEFQMPEVQSPRKLTLSVSGKNNAAQNEWDFFCFPKRLKRLHLNDTWTTPELHVKLAGRYDGLRVAAESRWRGGNHANETFMTTGFSDLAAAALASGTRVLLLSLGGLPSEKIGSQLGWWGPVDNQRGTGLASSPAFGSFPLENGLPNLALFRLLHEAVAVEGEFGGRLEPLAVTIGSGKVLIPVLKFPPWAGQVDVSSSHDSRYLANIFQTRVGAGRLFACGFQLLGNEPEAMYLLDMILQYVQSSQFEPRKSMPLSVLQQIASTKPAKKDDV